MEDSILTATKEKLGIVEDYTVFDNQIIDHINSAFSRLFDLGVGPVLGFEIEDKTAVWDDFTAGDRRLNRVKTYIANKVRMSFDPPPTSFTQNAIKELIKEDEYLLMAAVEVPALPVVEEEIVLEGGEP